MESVGDYNNALQPAFGGAQTAPIIEMLAANRCPLEVHVISRPLLVIFLIFALASCIRPMNAQNPPLPPPRLPGEQTNPAEDEAHARMEREMQKKANKDRYSALKRDTDKLLQLANELKTNVDKSSENTLSVDVVKKAEEIEKLARSVKDKMKGN